VRMVFMIVWWFFGSAHAAQVDPACVVYIEHEGVGRCYLYQKDKKSGESLREKRWGNNPNARYLDSEHGPARPDLPEKGVSPGELEVRE
jgi:hypothetical protein